MPLRLPQLARTVERMSEENIGNRVRAALERVGMPHKELADRLDLSRDKLSKSLGGSRTFTSGELADISDALRVDIYWLISGEPSRFSPRVAFRHEYDHDEQAHKEPTPQMRRELDNVARAYTQARLTPDTTFESFRNQVGANTYDPTAAEPWKGMRAVSSNVRRSWLGWQQSQNDPVLGMEAFLRDVAGVDLIVLDGDETARVQTYALEIDGNRAIVISRTAAWYSAVFGIFHELAHLLFGDPDLEGAEPRQQAVHPEKIANAFAANTLIGYDQVSNVDLSTASAEELARLLWSTTAGIDTLRYRCSTANRPAPSEQLRQARITELWHLAHLEDAGKREALWRAPYFPERLVNAHEHLVRTGDIPPDMLARMKQMPVEDVVVPQPSIELDKETRRMLEELGIPA